MEKWAQVKGYENIYEVSDFGSVRTVEGKKTLSARHGERTWKQRVLKQKTDKGGYKRVTLYKEKKATDFLVHRLVARAFCENPNNERIINHKDCNPSNNHSENLEWCSYRHNLLHAFENGLNKSQKKVTLKKLDSNEEYAFSSMASASKFLGKSNGYVSAIVLKGMDEIGGFKILKTS